MNEKRVRIFEDATKEGLEMQLNTWIEWIRYRIESIAYSASRDAYSALVYYRLLPPVVDKHATEPLEEQGGTNVKSI